MLDYTVSQPAHQTAYHGPAALGPSLDHLALDSLATGLSSGAPDLLHWLSDSFEFDKDARFILSFDLNVQFGNAKARELIEQGVLSFTGGRVRLGTPKSQSDLNDLLAGARGHGRRWRRKIAHLANGDWAVIRSRLLQDADGPSEGLIELVIKPAAPLLDSELAAVAEVFGLTPIESRVLLGLARAQCPKLIATACRVSVHTVRSHIRAIYAKLGTRSSAATQALVLGLRD